MTVAFKELYTELGFIEDWNEPVFGDLQKYGTMTNFDQTEFVAVNSTKIDGEPWTFEETHWNKEGLIFTPNACLEKMCHVHFSFHGCEGSPGSYSDYAMLNPIAAANDVIVVYPGSLCWDMD